jgi:hypothetical protein
MQKGVRSSATSWAGFDDRLAGGPVRKLSNKGIKISDRGIDMVERHVGRFGADKANAVMVGRLRDVATGKLEATQQDMNFYTHEIREFVRYRRLGWERGVPSNPDEALNLWRQAHTASLDDYGLPLNSDELIYHPDALNHLWD